MTQINGTSGNSGLPARGAAAPAASTAPHTGMASDGREAGQAPPTDVARAMKVLAGLALPAPPRIMFRDATRDAYVREAAGTLVRAQRTLELLREAALDPRTPVSAADWERARALVAQLGRTLAAVDRNHVRGEAFAPLLAPHHEALQAAHRWPEAPRDPQARARWQADGEAVLVRAREAVRAMRELAADTGVDPFLTRTMSGEVVGGPSPDHLLDALAARLHAPPPGKLDGLKDLIRGVAAVAEAVELAPDGQVRARRR